MSRTLRALLVALVFAMLPAAASAQLAIVGEAVHEREAQAGQSYVGSLRISNTGAEPREARLYQTDYQFFADGRTLYERSGAQPRSNASWITALPARILVPPGESVDVRYTVTVPCCEPLHGSYWSVVMVEGLAPDAAPTARDRRRVDMRATLRYAVQVATHVGTAGAPRIAFTAATARRDASQVGALDVDLTNTGDRAVRPALTLELYAADGRQVGSWQQGRGLLYPGSSIHQHFALGAIPAGTYKAVLVADGGGDAVFGAQYTLRF